jgi:hypothetical protein
VLLIECGQTQALLVRLRIAAAAHYHTAPARNGYNVLMPRAALFALLVASILGGSLQAQRGTATFRGSSAARSPVRSGFVGRRGFRSHSRHDNVGSVFLPYFFPYDDSYGYEQPPAEAVTNGPAPPVVISQTPELAPVPKAQVIEIPGVANSTPGKMLPPTVFILANGERLETRRYVLTASRLSVSIDRQQRTLPLDMLDINATIAANHERGIDLQIPADRTEISLSF